MGRTTAVARQKCASKARPCASPDGNLVWSHRYSPIAKVCGFPFEVLLKLSFFVRFGKKLPVTGKLKIGQHRSHLQYPSTCSTLSGQGPNKCCLELHNQQWFPKPLTRDHKGPARSLAQHNNQSVRVSTFLSLVPAPFFERQRRRGWEKLRLNSATVLSGRSFCTRVLLTST